MPTFFHHGVSIPTPMTPSRCYSGSWAAAVAVVVATHRLPDDLRCSAFVLKMDRKASRECPTGSEQLAHNAGYDIASLTTAAPFAGF